MLEFFLPLGNLDFNEQKRLLGSILAKMKPHFQSLKIAYGIELQDNVSIEIIEARNEKHIFSFRFDSIPITQSSKSPPRHALPNVAERLPLEPSKHKIMAYFDDINDGGSISHNAVSSLGGMLCFIL